MSVARRYLWLAIAGVALLQTAALGKIVWDRRNLLETGREIVMQVTPVDPRDIFRGDYVILGFPQSRIEYSVEKNGPLPAEIESGAPVYVTMTPGADNAWSVHKISAGYPGETAAADAVFKGRIERIDRAVETKTTWIDARFGIESYFVPEGTGKDLEQKVRDKAIQAVIALGPDGTPALKGLIIGGERHIDPPLF